MFLVMSRAMVGRVEPRNHRNSLRTSLIPAPGEAALFVRKASRRHGHDGCMNKTGTMDGISTFAGYAETKNNGRVRFVISLNSNDGDMRVKLLRAIQPGL